MWIELDVVEPDDYMGFTGPLVKVYEQLAYVYEHGLMSDLDWDRGKSLCELDKVVPFGENMFQRVQKSRVACLIEIEDQLRRLGECC